MDTTCVGAALLPHPPIMLPEIGGAELQKMQTTVESVTDAAELLLARSPETLVIVSPHNYIFSNTAALLPTLTSP